MPLYVKPSLLTEWEEELEEEHPLSVGLGAPELEMPTRCPADSPRIVRGFDRYSDNIYLLPLEQQKKLDNITLEITRSVTAPSVPPWPGSPPVPHVTQILVIGHADLDAARESREPGFLQGMSEKRALSVSFDLQCRMDLFLAKRIRWVAVGHGARSLAVSAPRTEAERKCNRRVEIILVRGPQPTIPFGGRPP